MCVKCKYIIIILSSRVFSSVRFASAIRYTTHYTLCSTQRSVCVCVCMHNFFVFYRIHFNCNQQPHIAVC